MKVLQSIVITATFTTMFFLILQYVNNFSTKHILADMSCVLVKCVGVSGRKSTYTSRILSYELICNHTVKFVTVIFPSTYLKVKQHIIYKRHSNTNMTLNYEFLLKEYDRRSTSKGNFCLPQYLVPLTNMMNTKLASLICT